MISKKNKIAKFKNHLLISVFDSCFLGDANTKLLKPWDPPSEVVPCSL
jgi:hypothetical protein